MPPAAPGVATKKEDSSMADELGDADIAMDRTGLYREETFTDRRVGTLQRLTPVTPSGDTDATRPVLYVGQTQVLTPAGALPLSVSRSCAASRHLRSSCPGPLHPAALHQAAG
jgi:hypothetical protein